MSYEQTVKLKHNEQAAIVNVETGEIKPLIKKITYKDDPKLEKFEPNYLFSRINTQAWKVLKTQTTDAEYRIAFELALKAKAFTNSLQPLNDDTTAVELAELFKVSVNTVKKTCQKLFDLGVYGRFEVTEQDKAFKKYWIFNPYLSFNGKALDKGVNELFKNTTYAMLMRSSSIN